MVKHQLVALLSTCLVSMATAVDDECDIPIDVTRTDQYIVWANGGLGATAFIHFDRADREWLVCLFVCLFVYYS